VFEDDVHSAGEFGKEHCFAGCVEGVDGFLRRGVSQLN
jgi:hypothetical protein